MTLFGSKSAVYVSSKALSQQQQVQLPHQKISVYNNEILNRQRNSYGQQQRSEN